MNIDNEAVDLKVSVELSWYILGHQFAELNTEEQYQFLFGMIENIEQWENTIGKLCQLDEIVGIFNEHSPDEKKPLAYLLEEFAIRLRADAGELHQGES